MTHPIHDSRYSWLRLLVTLAIAAVANVGMWAVIVVMPAIETQFGASRAEASMPYTLAMIGFALGNMWLGQVVDRLGGVHTLLIGSILQCIALFLFLPYDGMVSLYVISLLFGLAQGGIVPSYALVVREYMPPQEAGARVGFVMMMTIMGMALGGWMSGWLYDVTGKYELAFVNGILWNGLNIAIIATLLMRSRPRHGRVPA